MNNYVKIVAISLGLFTGSSAVAVTPAQDLGTCLVDTLNGKERKKLAKWIFFGIGAHPEMKRFMNATATDIEDSDKYIGKLITKILTVDCPDELYSANKSDPLALQKAFGLVGQVAMQELMSNEEAMKAISNYAEYTDDKKINEILSK